MRLDEARQHEGFLYVFCDSEFHAGREVPVTNFVRLPDGTWDEVAASRAGKKVGTGYHLIGDAPARPGWALDPEVSNADVRDRHVLRCRKCKHRIPPVVMRPDTRDRVCEFWAALGVRDVTLAQLTASLTSSSGH